MKIIPKSVKAKIKAMKGPILERMAEEQNIQADLRITMVTSKDDEEVAKAKELFNESVQHWNVLKESLEEYNKLSKKEFRVTPDTLLVVAGNLLGIFMILTYEKTDIIRSKAISFILKGRV